MGTVKEGGDCTFIALQPPEDGYLNFKRNRSEKSLMYGLAMG